MAKKVYFTIAGTQYRHGSDFMKKGMEVKAEVYRVVAGGVLCKIEL